jgi:glycosyltransferase involved in cell wall biosynthesis
MRVAVVNQFSSAGGGARFTRALVSALAAEIPDIEIGLFADAANAARDAVDELFADIPGVTVVPVHRTPSRSAAVTERGTIGRAYWWLRRKLKRVPLFTSLYYSAKAQADRLTPGWSDFALDSEAVSLLEQYDVIYLAWPYYIEPRRFTRPVVVTMHDFNFKYPFGNFTPRMLAVVERQVPEWIGMAAAVVVSSQFMADELERFYPRLARQARVVRLTHFTITEALKEEMDETADALGLPDKFMLCASNTSSHKNLQVLLKAVGELKRRGRAIPLVLAGHGTDNIGLYGASNFPRNHPLYHYQVITRQLQEDELQVGRDIWPLGYVSDRQIDTLIKMARLVVSPSLYEAGSGPGVDAWSSGTPVAFSNIPPFVEHLHWLGTQAWVFDPHDASKMADVLDAAYTDDGTAIRMAAESREAISHRTWGQIAREYYEVFATAVDRHDG